MAQLRSFGAEVSIFILGAASPIELTLPFRHNDEMTFDVVVAGARLVRVNYPVHQVKAAQRGSLQAIPLLTSGSGDFNRVVPSQCCSFGHCLLPHLLLCHWLRDFLRFLRFLSEGFFDLALHTWWLVLEYCQFFRNFGRLFLLIPRGAFGSRLTWPDTVRVLLCWVVN